MQSSLEMSLDCNQENTRVLGDSLDHGIHITKCSSFSIQAFCDAEWASDPDNRRFTSGYCVLLGSNIGAWKSKKQQTISRSSIEAEFCTVAVVVIEYNNDGWKSNALTKHIEIDLHYVQDNVPQGHLQVLHVPSQDQLAKCLTKAISSSSFPILQDKLSVVSASTLSLRGS
uniref:Copia protein n=1 Tax=Cannabis sativa TaxID=3483 RepID=A0A803PC43_CANSA